MTLRNSLENRLGGILNVLISEELRTNESTQIRLMGYSMVLAIGVTSVFMSCITTMDYWLYNTSKNIPDAIFVFIFTIISAILIWLFNIGLNVFFVNNIKLKSRMLEFFLKLFVSLCFASLVMMVWYFLDTEFDIEAEAENLTMPKLILRGMYISLFANTSIWATESSIAMHRQRIMLTQLKEENFEARYELLKQQVNPHFLFNSLNILKGMIRTRNENAEEYLIKLADVYRYVLQANINHEVHVSEELGIMEAYFFMLSNRFRDAIDLEIKLSVETQKAIVPSLSFQLLMENCVKHNILTSVKKLYVKIYERDGYIIFENNLQQKNAIESSNNVGLQNLIQRFKYITEKQVEIIKTNDFFKVKMPIVIKKVN
jgi:two-component system, LytTR family, sensor kinase